MAVCPTAALDNARAPLARQAALPRYPVLEPALAEQFLRARRSIRNYQEKQVPCALIERLLTVARCAPTGANSQGISFVVMQDPAALRAIIEQTVAFLEAQANTPAGRFYGEFAKVFRRTGKDIVLRGAPCLVLTLAAPGHPMAVGNTHAIIAYAELFATALGLGSCWAGFVGMAAGAGWQPLLAVIQPPAGKAVTGGFMLGYPQFTYCRLVDRQPLEVVWR